MSTAAVDVVDAADCGRRRNTISSTSSSSFFPLFAIAKDLDFPLEFTHRDTQIHRRSTQLQQTNPNTFPYSAAADAGCFSLDFVALARRHTSLTFARFFSVNRLLAFLLLFASSFLVSVFNANFSRKFSSFF